MKIVCVYKKNRNRMAVSVHPRIRHMLQLCADDLTSAGYDGLVKVIFQTGRSHAQSLLYGLCWYKHRPTPLIYIYTYRRRVPSIINTIAHEFGHVSHFYAIPSSSRWTNEKAEQYAELYEKLMRKHFDATYNP